MGPTGACELALTTLTSKLSLSFNHNIWDWSRQPVTVLSWVCIACLVGNNRVSVSLRQADLRGFGYDINWRLNLQRVASPYAWTEANISARWCPKYLLYDTLLASLLSNCQQMCFATYMYMQSISWFSPIYYVAILTVPVTRVFFLVAAFSTLCTAGKVCSLSVPFLGHPLAICCISYMAIRCI